MSVWIKPLTPVDDWKHVEDRTEPPEEREDERTCGTCHHWEGCPCGCEWGLCDILNDLMREGSPKCKDYEEA